MILLNILQDSLTSTNYRDSINIAMPLIGFIIDDADNLFNDFLCGIDVPQDQTAGGTSANQHDTPGRQAIYLCLPILCQ